MCVRGCPGASFGLTPKAKAWPRACRCLTCPCVRVRAAGYTLWVLATAAGEAFTCSHQDDGYAGTLANKHVPNDKGELGRAGDVFTPGKVRVWRR